MNLLRRYKISKLDNSFLSDDEKELIDFIKGWLSDLVIYTDFPEHIFYIKPDTDEWVFYILNNEIGIRYDGFYEIFENGNPYLKIDDNIRALLEFMILEIVKRPISNFFMDSRMNYKKWTIKK